MPIETPFSDAVRDFRDFLQSNERSRNIVWVFREDVAFHGRRFWVRSELSKQNKALVMQYYDLGLQRELGLRLACLCELGADSVHGTRSVCYLFVPGDDLESEQAMMGPESLSFSVQQPSPLQRFTRTSRGGIEWRYRQWRGRHATLGLSGIPLRKDVRAIVGNQRPDGSARGT